MNSPTWYYVRAGGERQGPVPREEIQRLASAGELAPADLVWAEGMSDWMPLSTVAELQPQPVLTMPGQTLVPEPPPSAVPAGLRGWTSFVGVMNILSGIGLIFSCVGMLPGIFLVAGGAALLAANTALADVSAVSPGLVPYLRKIRVFMTMMGVTFIVSVITALVCVGVLTAMAAASTQ